jgi:hypothetical protein
VGPPGDDGGPGVATGDAAADAPAPPGPDAMGAYTCATPAAPAATARVVRFDMVGYVPEGAKWAVVLGPAGSAPSFEIVDAATKTHVASGTAGPRVLDTTSLAGVALVGDRIDLSGITKPGSYTVRLGDGSEHGPIVVDANAWARLLPMTLRFLGAQRCGQTTAAVSQHGACHLHASIAGAHSGDGVAVDEGYTGDVDAMSGTVVDVEGGWHDAGDYLKFLGTTSFVLVLDLLALRDHAGALKGPRLGASYDALRAEMRWGLDWVVRMVGGAEMYHQVSGSNDHDVGWRLPESDTATPVPGYDQRPVFRLGKGRGGNLLGRAAAALALGSQVFAGDAAYAASLQALAKQVYAAGVTRPTAQASDPSDFYDDGTVDDDLALAAALLAQSTSDKSYLADALTHARAIGPAPSSVAPLHWGDTSALAYLETALAEPAGSAERSEMAGALAALASRVVATATGTSAPGAAFGYADDVFDDGTIEQSLGAAAVCLASRRLGGDAACVEIARSQIHWMLGQNPFGLSFMVGAAPWCPVNLHHSLPQVAKVNLVGAIVGGPTSTATLQDVGDPDIPMPGAMSGFARWSTAGLLYDDVTANYVVNEPAIDFTAPLVFDLAELLDGT